MKRVLSTVAVSILASSLMAAPAFAQGNGNGNGNGNGGGNSAAADAPGQNKGDGMDATGFAPGQVKGDDESARSYAPGQVKNDDVDPDTTASTGQPNFGTVISSVRAGKSSLFGITDETEVNVVDVDDLAGGNSRAALDNALADNQEQIESLRNDLAGLDDEFGLGLSDDDVANAVATQVDDDTLTVFVD